MEGMDVVNKRIATTPLTINLPDGTKVKPSHVCDIEIPGLPTVLMGHIMPLLTVVSLIGIHPLCKAGCKVAFDDKTCDVIFDGKVILRGFKDSSTNLWTLPIGKNVCATPGPNILSSASSPPPVVLATFTHLVPTCSSAVKFAHQSLCSPKISTLLKAVRRRFLKGCPNMTEPLIRKYLNPRAATAKGHIKRPRHGIRSTRTRTLVEEHNTQVQVAPVPVILPFDNAPPVYQPIPLGPNIIANNDDQCWLL